MAAVWMRLRAEARARWRAWLGLAVLAGVFGGAVVAAAIGASRTGSVVDRSLETFRPPDVFIAPEFISFSSEDPEAFVKALRFENLLNLPSVTQGARLLGFAVDVPEAEEEIEVLAPEDPRFGREIFGLKLLEGRLPDPRRADEATVNVKASRLFKLHAGDTYTIQFLRTFPGIGGPDVPEPAHRVRFHITGVTAHVSDVAEIAGASFGLTPAFLDRYGERMRGYQLSMLRLRDGTASYDEFDREIQKLSGGESVLYVQSGDWGEARRSFSLQSAALWILAGILTLVTILVIGQTVARQTFLDSTDHPVLRALGISHGGLVGLGILRGALIAFGAAVVAIIVASAASPLTPFGNARIVDPDAGFSVPAGATLLGFVGIFVAVVALVAYPAWRAARAAAAGIGPSERISTDRPSVVAEAFSRAARAPAAGVGVRMALEAGRGRTAVPVRTTVAATAIGVVALVAALIVAASLDRLTHTPRLYGWNWDVVVSNDSAGEEGGVVAALQGFARPDQQAALLGIDGIADAAFGPLGGIIIVDGVSTEPYGLSLGARVHPPILEGRQPRAPREIAIARKTLRATGKDLGDIVRIRFPGTPTQEKFRIVGITVLPIVQSDIATFGDGVWIPLEGVAPLFGGRVPMDGALVRFEAGADPVAVIRSIKTRFGDDSVDEARAPGTVLDFGRVENMPYLLAGLVALLAIGTLTHGLVTAVRRRRRELAVLKTLGLDKGQVRRAVAWQATTTTLVTLLVGIPLGVIVGRWVWMTLANQSGFAPEPVASLAVLGLIVPAALVAANLIAALPGRSAARTRPALVLRTE